MISVITPNDNARPSSRPFVINNSTGTAGTATGDDQACSCCDPPQTEAFRYRLDMSDHQYIFQFQSTTNGVTKSAYCLDKFTGGSYNDILYQSAPFETIFPSATARQKQILAWIMANAFPVTTTHQTLALAGVDDSTSPPLDDNDAHAAVQVTLWILLG